MQVVSNIEGQMCPCCEDARLIKGKIGDCLPYCPKCGWYKGWRDKVLGTFLSSNTMDDDI